MPVKIRQLLTAALAAATSVLLACSDSATTIVETAPDGTFVSVSGRVAQARADQFVLDYGDGEMIVEMDDYDFYTEASALLVDDDVIVYGYIDDDFYEKRSLEASSVYVKDLGTQFYASGVDEESIPAPVVMDLRPRIELTGEVKRVTGGEFDLETSAGIIDVNVQSMSYDPLDDEGFQQIEPGDRVRVTGALGYELFADLDLMADTIVSLEPHRGAEG